MNTKSNRTVLIIVILVLVAVFFFLGIIARPLLWKPQPPGGPSKNVPARPTTEIFQGEVKLAGQQSLVAPADGTVVALGATETLPVKADQLILQISSPQAHAKLQAAWALLKAAQAQSAAPARNKFHDKLLLAQAHLQSTASMRQQGEKQLAEFRALNPAAEQAQANAIESERLAVAAAQKLRSAQAALDAAQKRIQHDSDRVPAELANLQAAFQARRQEDAAAQTRLQAAMKAHLQQREAISTLRRQQREVASLRHSETVFTGQLQQLQRSPLAQAATSRDQAVKTAQAQVAAAEDLVNACALKAPENGTLTQLRARPGMKVKAGTTLAVIDAEPVPRLVFQIPAALAANLAPGRRAEIRAAGGRAFAAAVSHLVKQQQTALVYFQPLAKMTLPAVGTALTAQVSD